jgi:flagellar motor switch protein FliN
MSTEIQAKALAEAFAVDVVTALGAGLNVAAAATPAGEPDAAKQGWTAAVAATGTWRGELAIWIDHESLAQVLKAARQLDAAPDAAVITATLTDIVSQAGAALGRRSGFEGITCAAPTVQQAPPPSDASAFDISLGAAGKCLLAIAVEPAAAVIPASERLQAVLEVDLPLVVRFGRAVLPLKTLADLVSGSMVDMHRSPDEPVELLVGERVIAKGEVVIVGGNYGVRITELMHEARSAGPLEA